MTFEEWLEKEFGPICVYDFDTQGGMDRWVGEMKKAFEAGFEQGWNESIDTYDF